MDSDNATVIISQIRREKRQEEKIENEHLQRLKLRLAAKLHSPEETPKIDAA